MANRRKMRKRADVVKHELHDHHVLGLAFLERQGPHPIRDVGGMESIAAAHTFLELRDWGLVFAGTGPDGPIFQISASGRRALVHHPRWAWAVEALERQSEGQTVS